MGTYLTDGAADLVSKLAKRWNLRPPKRVLDDISQIEALLKTQREKTPKLRKCWDDLTNHVEKAVEPVSSEADIPTD